MKKNKTLYQSLTVLFSVLIITLGWIYFVYGTTIGTNIITVDFTVTGNASTTGTLYANGNVILGSNAADTLTVNATATFASTTILNGSVTAGTNFYIDANGNASTTGTFIAGTTTADNLTIGGGTAVSQHLSATTSFDFAALATSTCISTSTALSGVSAGDTVIATPEPVATGIETLNMGWNAYASTTNEVALRICNIDDTAVQNPADQTWRFDAWMH